MRKITITLSDDVAHRLEVMAARDDNRIDTGIEQVLTYIVEQYEKRGAAV